MSIVPESALKGQQEGTAQAVPEALFPASPVAGGHQEAALGGRDGLIAGAALGKDGQSALLECYENGARALLDLPAAWRALWQVDFGWILPTDFYRWQWGGHHGRGQVLPITLKCGRKFGFCLLTRTTPLTYWDMIEYDPDFDDALFNAFIARASRFNRLFPKEIRRSDPLLKYYPILHPHQDSEPAYRLVPEKTTLVIAGVDQDSGSSAGPVDWRALENPPEAKATTTRRR